MTTSRAPAGIETDTTNASNAMARMNPLNAKDTAELLNIDWRAILRSQRQIAPSKAVNLDAAPLGIQSEGAPLALDQTPDTWLRLLIKFYKPTEAVLFHYALRLCRGGPLAGGFTRDEFVQAARARL